MQDERISSISAFLFREASALDERRWEDWLALFTEDTEFWVPAWDSETTLTNDPNSELSLIYYNSRIGLEDRVFRMKTGKSSASTPPARTCHLVTNIRSRPLENGDAAVDANWHTLSFRFGQSSSFFGYYNYLLVPHMDSWRIRRKKVTVLNDIIPNVLDVNLV